MIRKLAMAVMLVSLILLVGNVLVGNSTLVGHAIAAQCDDSDLTEVNDALNGNVFSRERYSTLNYNIPGTVRGIHSLLRIPVTMKDNCLSSTRLTEYYCDVKQDLVVSAAVDCPMDSRCYGGACVPLLCKDNDGFNVTANSSVEYNSAIGSNFLIAEDYCKSNTTLVEFICQGEEVVWPGGIQNSYPYPHDLRLAVHHQCPAGTICLKGACTDG
ncbi:hypothetical protein HY496_03675 [Candidatus Woesearchaeota archaeon]|nr:hypothetical protein [Candidatus Woesearchaeota archaeon]